MKSGASHNRNTPNSYYSSIKYELNYKFHVQLNINIPLALVGQQTPCASATTSAVEATTKNVAHIPRCGGLFLLRKLLQFVHILLLQVKIFRENFCLPRLLKTKKVLFNKYVNASGSKMKLPGKMNNYSGEATAHTKSMIKTCLSMTLQSKFIL